MTDAGRGVGPGGAPPGYVVRALIRQLCTVTALTVLYFVLPLTGPRDGQALALLTVGLIGFGVLVVWQVRAVLHSPHPVVQGVEALAVTVPFYLLLYSAAYVLMSSASPAAFSEDLDRVDALYFTMTVFATVGFGDIAPVTRAARAVVTVQMATNLVVLGLVLRLVTRAVRINRDRRRGADRHG